MVLGFEGRQPIREESYSWNSLGVTDLHGSPPGRTLNPGPLNLFRDVAVTSPSELIGIGDSLLRTWELPAFALHLSREAKYKGQQPVEEQDLGFVTYWKLCLKVRHGSAPPQGWRAFKSSLL
jgi:hypothetical protein